MKNLNSRCQASSASSAAITFVGKGLESLTTQPVSSLHQFASKVVRWLPMTEVVAESQGFSVSFLQVISGKQSPAK